MRTRTLFITTLLAGGLASCSLYSSDPTQAKHHPTAPDAPAQPQIDAGIWVDAYPIGDATIIVGDAPDQNYDSGFYPDAGIIVVSDGGSGSGCNHDGGQYLGDAPIQDPIDAAQW